MLICRQNISTITRAVNKVLKLHVASWNHMQISLFLRFLGSSNMMKLFTVYSKSHCKQKNALQRNLHNKFQTWITCWSVDRISTIARAVNKVVKLHVASWNHMQISLFLVIIAGHLDYFKNSLVLKQDCKHFMLLRYVMQCA